MEWLDLLCLWVGRGLAVLGVLALAGVASIYLLEKILRACRIYLTFLEFVQERFWKRNRQEAPNG